MSCKSDVERFNASMISGKVTSKPINVGRQFTAEELEARDNQMREGGAKAERERFNTFLDFVIHTGELQYHSTFGCYDIHEQFKDIFDKAKSLRSPGQKQDHK